MDHRATLGFLIVVAGGLVTASSSSGETLYFKNKRVVEAVSHQRQGALIQVTMSSGLQVHMRADSVDWEGTEKLKQGGYVLRPTSYEEVDFEGEGGAGGPARTLTASDLKKIGSGLKIKRAEVPTMVVEVPADQSWTDSGINVRSGQLLIIRASGEVVLGPGMQAGPGGLERGDENATSWIKQLPFGSLLLRIGLGGDPISVGAGNRVVAVSAGRLYFTVNDRTTEDNAGAFSVRVELPVPGSGAPGTSDAGTLGSGRTGTAAAPAAPSRQRAPGMVGVIDRARDVRRQVQTGTADRNLP